MKDRLITWSILLVLMAVSILPGFAQTAQLDITGNLVNNTQTATTTTSTWQGAVFQNSLTCWEPGGPGYCGPNPIVRPDGNVNFSYGLVNLHQRVNVGKALPYGGSGLVTTGFRFQWTSKNGNGWDDGRQDQLDAYVKLYSTGDSKVIESFNYDLNFKHDWTTYTWEKNWANTRVGYRENQVGNVQFGFVGMDNNYWAGPYGPEIRDISFQLKYKPDPCKNNPLYSTECPNFLNEIQKANSTPVTESTKTAQIDNNEPPPKDDRPKREETEFGEKPEGASEHYYSDKLESALYKIFDDQVRQEERGLEIAQDAVDKTQETSDRVTKQAESIARDSQAKSIRESLETKPEMLGQRELKRDSQENIFSIFQGPNSTSSITTFSLPGPQNNQFSLQAARDIGQPEQATTRVNSQAQQQQQTQSTLNLFAISRESQQQVSLTSPVTSTPQIQLFTSPQQPVLQTQIFTSQQSNIQTVLVPQLPQLPQQQELVSVVPVILQPTQLTQTVEVANVAQPVVQVVSEAKNLAVVNVELPVIQTSFLTNKADPINQALDSKPELTTTNTQEQKTTVNQKSQDSELANGVSISTIARTPQNFTSYLVALQDVQFYKPREIYRNQRVVDNQRALRQMASDRLHQEMIELQYRSR